MHSSKSKHTEMAVTWIDGVLPYRCIHLHLLLSLNDKGKGSGIQFHTKKFLLMGENKRDKWNS